jgi:hypothetical protein
MTSRARTDLQKWRDAVRDSELKSTAKLVALVLSTRMNRHLVAYPSKETIATDCSLSRRSVDAAVDVLEKAGYLQVSRSRGRSSNNYTGTTPQELQGSRPPTVHDVPGNPATDAPQPGSKRPPTPQELPSKASESIPPFPPFNGREGGSSNGERPETPNRIEQHELNAYVERLREAAR